MAADLSTLDKRFVRKLKEFATYGYAFNAQHSLRKGTRQDHDAKGTQREAFDAYIAGFEKGHRHGYFEIPTGVGKTALFISLVKNYLHATDKKDGPRSLIVVPSEKLAVQTAKALAKFLPELAPTIETDDDQGKEIDWENSHIGLQYSRIKHAVRKPRVLITTYQSLNRDRENKVYPPEEYGMVIYDEGHALTGDQYGQAVDKFRDSIQLAVSATPEYSLEKAVAARLPHLYYQLPISEAINRGDLCNVRPVLLKTNYTVDKKKFKELASRGGKRLSDEAITTLLNQQTRNQTAMEAYLLGSDPDSGERYLGQNGMIFCGTTDHVDDFARQFDSLLNKTKYRPVRQWLNEEGIEIIAPVHGKIKGTLLKKGLLTNNSGKPITEGRKYEGNKEWYSEEEIFDLHAKGKILLLASVKKLKEGYDSPRDSIIIDTVDRLSKVDATQIDGRGFRLNPPNPEYNDPGNPDKTCTVINMVDQNTFELYEDDPTMLPIYCAEVIEGAQFRTPARRKHIMKMWGKQPPDLDTQLEAADFKLITDIAAVRQISKENKKKRDEAEPIEKPEGTWSASDLVQNMGISVATASRLLKSLDDQLKASGNGEATYLDISIPRDAVIAFGSSSNPMLAIKQEWGGKIATAYRNIADQKDIWTGEELAGALGLTASNGVALINELARTFSEDEALTEASRYGLKIPRDAICQHVAKRKLSIGIKKEWGEKLAVAYKAAKQPQDVWSGAELGERLGLESASAARIIRSLYEQFKADESLAQIIHKGIEIPRDAIVAYGSDKQPHVGIKVEWGKKLKEAYGEKEKPHDVLSPVEFGETLGLTEKGGRHIIKTLRDQFDAEASTQSATYMGFQFPRGAVVEYRNEGHSTYGIKKEWADKYAEHDKKKNEKPKGMWSTTDFAANTDRMQEGAIGKLLKKIRQKFEDASINSVTCYGVNIPRIAIATYYYKGIETTAIDPNYARQIAEHYIPYVDAFKSRKSPAHMADDERDKAKRGGYGRGGD